MKSAKPSSRKPGVSATWLGHSAFRFDTPAGKILLIDPWLDNPKAPAGAADLPKVDVILVTHGHGDHIGNTVEIAKRTGARVYAIHEVALHLQKEGVKTAEGMNKSGTIALEGMTFTMVDAKHSSGIEAGESILAGADPAGFVIRFENGLTVYHAGDTGVFLDMKLIGDLYKPEVVLLPIGGLYTMGPREAAKAVEFLRPRRVIGMHYGTFPLLTGTPEELKRMLPAKYKKAVLTLQPGVPVKI
jgi:L-ascorbate metabolism protein UlaG (beta-lactamase superfamily)